MKKYNKPQLFCEKLNLLPAILNACNEDAPFSNGNECPYEIEHLGFVFVQTNSCDYTGMDDLVCYHNPENAVNIIFGS